MEYLSSQFAPLQEMRSLLETYGKTINQITDNVDADEEERIQAYAELREHVIPQYEEAARQQKAEILERRQQFHSDVFGIPENSSPTATPADRNTAAMSYRDAIYRLQDATPEELDKAATIAEGTGDMALLRAVGFLAEDLSTTYRYLMRAGEKVHQKYTAQHAAHG